MASTHPVALEFLIEVICGLLGSLRQALTAFLAKAISLALFVAAFFVLALVTSFLMISAFVAAFLVLLKLLLSTLTAVTVSILTPFPQALDRNLFLALVVALLDEFGLVAFLNLKAFLTPLSITSVLLPMMRK